MNATIIERSIQMIDMNGQQIAEFLMLQNEDTPPQQWIKVIPYYGMHETYRTNANDPIVLFAGMTMPRETFLGYIANVISHTQNAQWYYQMRSAGAHGYAMINLRPSGVSAKEIADVTGYDIEIIRLFYRDFFVVNTEDK